MDKTSIKKFVESAQEGTSRKEDILEFCDKLENEIELANHEIDWIDRDLMGDVQIDYEQDSLPEDSPQAKKYEPQQLSEEELNERRATLDTKCTELTGYLSDLKTVLENYKNFDKTKCFSNIRELLQTNPDVKIGQIEKEAGVRLGYMSRLEKEGNTSEPSMEFIVSAAKLLRVSLDTLISVDIAGLTPTEQYIVKFFDKLKADTLADKLDWHIESPDYLNRLEGDINGSVDHPLFWMETFYEESECEYPEEVTRIVFSSHSFGPKTFICGDCFNLKMKNGTMLYLMDIEKSVHKVNDQSAYAKEIWTYTPRVGCKFLVCNKDETPIAPLVDTLYSVIKERMQHPKLDKDVMSAIDSFMKDDWSDDDNDDSLPFC